MRVTVEYCGEWNYRPAALSLKAEIDKEPGIDTELVVGKGGVFNVTVDKELIFSKFKLFRFPEPGEIANIIKQRYKI